MKYNGKTFKNIFDWGVLIGAKYFQVINKNNDSYFSDHDCHVFERYLQFCGLGLRNAQIYERSLLEVKRNQVLLDLAGVIFQEQSTLDIMIQRILTHVLSFIQCERAMVLLGELNPPLTLTFLHPSIKLILYLQSTMDPSRHSAAYLRLTRQTSTSPRPVTQPLFCWGQPQPQLRMEAPVGARAGSLSMWASLGMWPPPGRQSTSLTPTVTRGSFPSPATFIIGCLESGGWPCLKLDLSNLQCSIEV